LRALRQKVLTDPSRRGELAALESAAEKRRDDKYFAAAEKVRRTFERDLNELERQFDAESSEMQKAKAVEIRRMNRVIENLQIQKEMLEQDDSFSGSKNRAQSSFTESTRPPLGHR
jgi:archaellum component FlaC